jgi:hypothetical protein
VDVFDCYNWSQRKLTFHGSAVEISCACDELIPHLDHLLHPFREADFPDGFVPLRGVIEPYDLDDVLQHLSTRAKPVPLTGESFELFRDGDRYYRLDDTVGLTMVDLVRRRWRCWVTPAALAGDPLHLLDSAVLWPMAQLLAQRDVHLLPGVAVARQGLGVLLIGRLSLEHELSALLANGYRLVGQRWVALREEEHGRLAMLHLPGHLLRRSSPRSPARSRANVSAETHPAGCYAPAGVVEPGSWAAGLATRESTALGMTARQTCTTFPAARQTDAAGTAPQPTHATPLPTRPTHAAGLGLASTNATGPAARQTNAADRTARNPAGDNGNHCIVHSHASAAAASVVDRTPVVRRIDLSAAPGGHRGGPLDRTDSPDEHWLDLHADHPDAVQLHAFCDWVLVCGGGRRERLSARRLGWSAAINTLRRAWPTVDLPPGRRGGKLVVKIASRLRVIDLQLSRNPQDLLDLLR